MYVGICFARSLVHGFVLSYVLVLSCYVCELFISLVRYFVIPFVRSCVMSFVRGVCR